MPLKPSRGSTDGITASEDNVTLSRLSDEVKDVDSPTYDTASRQNGWDPETASAKTYEDAPLHRKLKSRHLTMIAIGGIIGPGLLVGSGSALAQAGPAGSLLAFALVGLIVFFVMQSLGELSTYAPVSGSFTLFAARYIDPAMSFALGWQYYWLFCTVMANEYNSFSLLLHYWPAARVVPEGAYIALAWFAILGFAFLGIRWYGELEYWLSLIKCLAIGLFFIVAIIINAGGIGGEYLGFRYWGTPGAFADGINGVAKIFVVAGTLFAGCESVGVVAGESANPAKAVPRAIRTIFWRIVFFYLGTVFFIGILIPYTEPALLSAESKAAASPFTIALSQAGISAGADVMNVIIIITVISAGNSSLYLTSRIVLNLARNGLAPKFLAITNNRGVPWPALIFSNAFGLLSLLKYAKGSGSGAVFGYLMNLSGVSTFIVWASILGAHLRFRAAMKAQGRSTDGLVFKALWYPYGAWAAFAACIFLIFFQGYTTFKKPFSAVDFVVAYLMVPVFVVSFFGCKWWLGTKVVKLREVDLDRDRLQVEKERRAQGIVEAEELEEENRRRRLEDDGGGKRSGLQTVKKWLVAAFV